MDWRVTGPIADQNQIALASFPFPETSCMRGGAQAERYPDLPSGHRPVWESGQVSRYSAAVKTSDPLSQWGAEWQRSQFCSTVIWKISATDRISTGDDRATHAGNNSVCG